MSNTGKTNLSGEPVYVRIETELRQEITDGVLNPGYLLPSESALMARFGASRDTVRRSLKELEHKGLIYARPGKGYFVDEPEHNLFSFYFFDEDKYFESKIHRINTEEPSDEVRAALDLPAKRWVIKISRIITLHSQPVAYDEKYLPYDKGEPLIETEINYAVFPDILSSKSPPFALCTKMEIGAENAPPAIRKILKCDENEALLVLSSHVAGQGGKKLGYGKKYLTKKWGRLEANSGYSHP